MPDNARYNGLIMPDMVITDQCSIILQLLLKEYSDNELFLQCQIMPDILGSISH